MSTSLTVVQFVLPVTVYWVQLS